MSNIKALDQTKFTCIQCGNPGAIPYLLDCEDFYLRKCYSADYWCCASCGLIQQSPIPTDVAVFYDAYPIHQKKPLLHRMMRRWFMSACYFNTRRFLAGRKNSGLLIDFGCGDGSFLDASRHPNLKVLGFEVDSVHAAYLESSLNIKIYSDEQAILHDCEGQADVVTMHFVLEHLTDINKAFETVNRLLKPGGIFYFVIPNISSWEARLFGKKWHNLDAPRHISFPEKEAIRQLTERWGFEITDHLEAPFPNGVAGSIPVILTGRFIFFVFLIFLPIGILLSRLFPSGVGAYWLKKKIRNRAGSKN